MARALRFDRTYEGLKLALDNLSGVGGKFSF